MNPIDDCQQLDAFLSGELSPAEQAAFEAHVAACGECREALDEQRWVDDLLRSPQRIALEPAPTRLIPAVVAAIKRKRRRRFVAAAAAAMVTMVAVWSAIHRESRPTTKADVAAVSPRPSAESVAPTIEVEPAVFIPGDDSIVVPVASEFPDVTIVQVYAAYRPDAE